jgi:hypothetical protein
MTMPLREILVNNAVTTLNGAIDASQTTITVNSGAVFPATGNFRIKIEDEIMLVRARSTNDLTVVRGYESTTGASHGDSLTVVSVLTAGALDTFGKDNEASFGYASAPPLGRLVAADGITPLTVSDFTWINQGTATATDQAGTIALRALPAGVESVRGLHRAVPATPWTVIAAFNFMKIRENVENMGLMTRESGTGKICLFSISVDGSGFYRPGAYNLNSATSFNSNILGRQNGMVLGKHTWMKLIDNATNILWSLSFDGIEWVQLVSISRTAFMAGGPNQVGFYSNNQGSTFDMVTRLSHWSTS